MVTEYQTQKPFENQTLVRYSDGYCTSNMKYYLVDGQFSCERIDDKVLVVAIGAKTFWQFTFLQVALGCSVRVLLLINIKNHNLIIKNQALGGRCEMRRESKYPI